MIDTPSIPAGEAAPHRTAPPRRRKKPEGRSRGCRALAAADLDHAAGIVGGHARRRYDRRAAVWTARADLVARLEANAEARLREAGQ
jgi:hypothetical protein